VGSGDAHDGDRGTTGSSGADRSTGDGAGERGREEALSSDSERLAAEPAPPRADDDRIASPSIEWSALLSRFGHGSDSALAELVGREAPRLLRRLDQAIPQRLRARVGASDIFQQTLIDLMRVQDRFDNRGAAAFRAMMDTMAEQRLARAIRRERAQKRDVLREVAPPDGFGAPEGARSARAAPIALGGDTATPSKIVRGKESAEKLAAALARLSESDREVIVLLDYDDVPAPEAAARLGIAVKALHKRHSRALARLRDQLRESGDAPHSSVE